MQPGRNAGDLFREIFRVLVIYVRGQFLIAAIVTALYLIGFAIAGVPWWFLMALVCGALNVIPRIGSIIALALVLLVALIGGADMLHLTEVLAVWVLVQGLEGFVISPRLLGRPLGLGPFTAFLAVLMGSLLFGPIGFFLAVPVLAVAGVIWRFMRTDSPKPVI